MKVNAINPVYTKPAVKTQVKTPKNLRTIEPVQTEDSVNFKGIKNGLRGAGVGILAGAFVGAFAMPALGILAGAATLGSIVGAVGAIRGLMESDKQNIFKS